MRQALSFLFACALGVAFAAVIVFGPNGLAS